MKKKKKKKPLAIAYCVSMEHFSVLVNGSTTSFCGSFEDLDEYCSRCNYPHPLHT